MGDEWVMNVFCEACHVALRGLYLCCHCHCHCLQRAMSEIAGLDHAIIEEEFIAIASRSPPAPSLSNSRTPLIHFEGFCVLMERLETLGERRTVFVDMGKAREEGAVSGEEGSDGNEDGDEDDDEDGDGEERPSLMRGRSRRYSVSRSNFDLSSQESLQAVEEDDGEVREWSGPRPVQSAQPSRVCVCVCVCDRCQRSW